jgi:hypothetical protein
MMSKTPEIYFSGCWEKLGHFVYLPNGKQVMRNTTWPWTFLDAKILQPREHGAAWLTHKLGWTAMGIGDMSVDKRPGSNSTFAIRGTYDFSQALYLVQSAFPHVIARIGKVYQHDER